MKYKVNNKIFTEQSLQTNRVCAFEIIGKRERYRRS